MNINKMITCLISLLFLTTTLAGCLNNDEEKQGSLVIAYEIQSDYENIDENPQQLADYLSEQLNYDVSLYSVDSEGAMIEALRFGNADIALMDSGAAWGDRNGYTLTFDGMEVTPFAMLEDYTTNPFDNAGISNLNSIVTS